MEYLTSIISPPKSPSVWREWIEIAEVFSNQYRLSVSLRVEGVD